MQIVKALTSKQLRGVFMVWLMFICGWWFFESFMPSFLYEKFNFNTSHIGYLLSFNGALYAAFQYAVVQKISHKLRPSSMFLWSTVFSGLAIVFMTVASNRIELYAAMVVFVLAMGFCIPGLITCISKMAPDSQQGQIMGMIGSMQALGTVVVMIAGGYLQALNINITILGGGILMIVSWLLFIILGIKKTVEPQIIQQ